MCRENPGLKSETWATHAIFVRASFMFSGGLQATIPLPKNISRRGPLNCRSLGFARDVKGEGGASMESSC
jgi:hypothetical protein